MVFMVYFDEADGPRTIFLDGPLFPHDVTDGAGDLQEFYLMGCCPTSCT